MILTPCLYDTITGTWTVVAKFPGGEQKLYRCSGSDTSSSYQYRFPPPLNWTPVRLDDYAQQKTNEKTKSMEIPDSTNNFIGHVYTRCPRNLDLGRARAVCVVWG